MLWASRTVVRVRRIEVEHALLERLEAAAEGPR